MITLLISGSFVVGFPFLQTSRTFCFISTVMAIIVITPGLGFYTVCSAKHFRLRYNLCKSES